MKIQAIFDEYIALKRPLISLQTYRTNLGYFNNHIAPRFGDRDINTIHYIDYQKFSNDMLIDHKPKTVKNMLIVLSTLYKYAKKMNYYDGDNIISYVDLPRFDNKRYFTLSVDLQKKYIKAILGFTEPIYKDIFLFLLHGRRVEEVLNVKWEQIDLVNGVLYLPSSHNKSKKNLSFKLTDSLIKVLSNYYDIAIETQGTVYPTGHIFLNPSTLKRFSVIRKPWFRLLKRAGLPKMRIHDIRHLVGTYCVNELNISIEEVSHTLGHTNITTTQRYVNPKPDNSKKVIDAMFNSLKDLHVQELENDIKIADATKELTMALEIGFQIKNRIKRSV